MSTPTLLACPFCGGPANFLDASEPRKPLYWAECKACGVPGADDVTVEGAAAKWNRRAALTQAADAGAAEPVGYMQWHEGKPMWGEACVCSDPVWPTAPGDGDESTSMPIFSQPQLQQAVARAIEDAALRVEALIADHVMHTQKSLNPEDHCSADDQRCEYVVAWRDAAAAIRQQGTP